MRLIWYVVHISCIHEFKTNINQDWNSSLSLTDRANSVEAITDRAHLLLLRLASHLEDPLAHCDSIPPRKSVKWREVRHKRHHSPRMVSTWRLWNRWVRLPLPYQFMAVHPISRLHSVASTTDASILGDVGSYKHVQPPEKDYTWGKVTDCLRHCLMHDWNSISYLRTDLCWDQNSWYQYRGNVST